MIRRIPLVPTLVVLLAVAVMVGLGFWQLDRLQQKEALLARYTAAAGMSAEVPWPSSEAAIASALFRRSRIVCAPAASDQPLSGRNAAGQPGWVHEIPCTLPGGGRAWLALGWSNDPAPRSWAGGEARGIVAERGRHAARLVADPPLAGLAANARPDPRDIPNNHLSYAVQWFLFAVTALVIYALALRRRWREAAGG